MTDSRKPCPSKAAWEAFLGDTLSDREFDALDRHRCNCTDCQSMLDELALLDVEDTAKDGVDEIPSLADVQRQRLQMLNRPMPDIPGYNVHSQIGIGGMGIVYNATQEGGLNRPVAIKVIRNTFPSESMIARFKREVQHLAGMNHPNIATVFDSGLLDDGGLFYVMELIDGFPLDLYCQDYGLSLDERLELVVQICRGVDYLRSKRMIHRDLKPSNILVSENSGESPSRRVVKIIDFGLAKETSDNLTTISQLTAPGVAPGTRSYMSPEQASASTDEELDFRTDVYSIGVICFQLLTGQLPLGLNGLSTEEVLRAIRTTDPLRPSKQVARAEPHEIAGHLSAIGLSQQELTKRLHNELDWVVRKAMEKDRERRYRTAGDLAVEIHRYLSGDSVKAHPPSFLYRGKKYFHNHKAICSLILTLIAGLAGTTYGLTLARKNAQLANTNAARERVARESAESSRVKERIARQQEAIARSNAEDRARWLADAVNTIGASLDAVDPKVSDISGNSTVPLFLVAIATELTDASFGDADEVLQLRMKAAKLLVDLGQLESSIPLLQNLIEKCQEKFGDEAEQTDTARMFLARTYLRVNKIQLAQDIYWSIFQRSKKTRGENDRVTLAAALGVGATQAAGGFDAEAIFMLEQVIERYKPDPERSDWIGTDARHQLGQVLLRQMKYEKAEQALRKVIKEFEESPEIDAKHPIVLEPRADLCLALEKQGKNTEALVSRRQILKDYSDQYPTDSGLVTRAKHSLAALLSKMHQDNEAIDLLRDCVKAHPKDQFGVQCRCTIVQILQKQGETTQAESLLREAFDVLERLPSDVPILREKISKLQKRSENLTPGTD